MNTKDELKKILVNNAQSWNKEESQDRALIYVDDFLNEVESKFKLLPIPDVSKSFTYKDISKVAEDLANEYSSDKKDPVWRDIRQDGIKAIQAFIDEYL